jgi:hypothetical protein
VGIQNQTVVASFETSLSRMDHEGKAISRATKGKIMLYEVRRARIDHNNVTTKAN